MVKAADAAEAAEPDRELAEALAGEPAWARADRPVVSVSALPAVTEYPTPGVCPVSRYSVPIVAAP